MIQSISAEYREMLETEIKRLEAHEGKKKITPQDIAVIRLLRKMLDNDNLIWCKSFIAPSVNAITVTQYTGINRWLLDGGEYITFKQLLEYNKKHKTNFRLPTIEEGDDFTTKCLKSPYIIVHYNVRPAREPTESELKKITNGEKVYGAFEDDAGKIMIKPPASSSYFRVYNTIYIADPDTGKSFPRLNIENYQQLIDGERIVSEYQKLSGVHIIKDTPGKCFFDRRSDTIHMSPLNTFVSKRGIDPVVEYYSAIFHEMGHSTGIKERCNRECFVEWTGSQSKEYSMEECVAELTATLLITELNVDHSKIDMSVGNSAAYIQGWLTWLLAVDKDNRYGKGAEKLVYAIRRAEKARNYILSWCDELKSSN